MHKRWQLFPENPEVRLKLAHKLNIHPIVAQVMLNRNIGSLSDAYAFLGQHDYTGDCQFPDTILDPVMTLINEAIAEKKRVMLWGDYDVDGMTSTAQMMTFFGKFEVPVSFRIPNRFKEGYGLHISVVEQLQQDNIDLLLILDCGVSNVKEITEIKTHTQAKVIVIDHHKLPDSLPPFDGMLNPKELEDSHYLAHLCTAGLVYYLIQTYCDRYQIDWESDDYIDLAALGTVADIAKLAGYNRHLVRHGLRVLTARHNIGIKMLLKESKFDKKNVGSRDVGFVIAPRLNSSGRLADASLGVQLLLASDEKKAQFFAQKCEKMNVDRRKIDQHIFNECVDRVEAGQLMNNHIIVVAGENWHAGVIGITASKLVGKYHRPVVIIAYDQHIGRASGRSCGEVDLYGLLKSCQSHFLTFGGHKQAAGFSIDPLHISAFIRAVTDVANVSVEVKDLAPILSVDSFINVSDISLNLIDDLAQLDPYGQGNEEPIFYTDQLEPVDFKAVGDGTHLKATFVDSSGRVVIDGIGFGLSHLIQKLHKKSVSLAFHVTKNEWNGTVKPQIQLVDIK